MTTTATRADFSFARPLFTRGTDLLGAEEIKAAFGLEVMPPPPPLSFTEDELTLARKRGEMLVCHPEGVTMKRIHEMQADKTSDGKRLLYDTNWYANEAFFTTDALRPGWRLVSREVVPSSRRKNYLGQTAVLVGEIAAVYGSEMPEKVRQAVEEFDSQKEELGKLLQNDWREAAKRLVALKVNQLFRETPVETLWSLALYEHVNHKRLLPSGSWSWTNKLSSLDRVVAVGDFGGSGVRVAYDRPGLEYGLLGLRFSRSGSVK